MPSNPELLDCLAVKFRESGWDIKKMHKLIVMSATYQQSSKNNPDLLEADPDNLLLARGPSFRMTAEMVRDNALSISGLLAPKLGSGSAYPYQPEGLWDEISTKSWRYPYLQEPGDGLYRRSLYTIWKRTSGPPSMMIFDVGDRSECKVRRTETSTPLQALVLLNDPQYVEAARVTAEKLIKKYAPEEQLAKAFKLSTGRQADEKEMQIIQQFYQEEKKRFDLNENDAIAYLSTGSKPVDVSLDPVRVASLATVISGIMNTTDGYTIR
jgi:phosphopantetheinyl transferase (holo-ACP synthase)